MLNLIFKEANHTNYIDQIDDTHFICIKMNADDDGTFSVFHGSVFLTSYSDEYLNECVSKFGYDLNELVKMNQQYLIAKCICDSWRGYNFKGTKEECEVYIKLYWGEPISKEEYEIIRKSEMTICSHHGEPMFQGYCITDTDEYYCSDECLHQKYSQDECVKMYNHDEMNWSEWY